MNDYGLQLVDHHAALLADSAITVDVARRRGYRTAQSRKELGSRGTNQVVLRAEGRYGFAVRRPAAFTIATLAGV